MADYQTMYAVLSRKIAAVIEELQNAQNQTEEMYISSEPPNIKIADIDKTETQNHNAKQK